MCVARSFVSGVRMVRVRVLERCEIQGRVYAPGDVIELDYATASYQAEYGMVSFYNVPPLTYQTRHLQAEQTVLPPVPITVETVQAPPPPVVEPPVDPPVKAPSRRGRRRQAAALSA